MLYPLFFECVESIVMRDPLSEVLGSFEHGHIEYTYLDIVKAAGHSCPTVAGAYLMTWKGLEALYPKVTPLRGEIEVSFKEGEEEGAAGVIGNVIGHITGATHKSGFKGLAGKFARHSLLHFSKEIPSSVRFTRKDTGASVDVYYDPSGVLPASTMPALMAKILKGDANDEEKKEFAHVWQERVEKILCVYHDDEAVVRVEAVA